jgi:serine/threonine-protein kinase
MTACSSSAAEDMLAIDVWRRANGQPITPGDVVELMAGSNTTTRVVPFIRDSNLRAELGDPGPLAVDAAGNIYVADNFFRRVVVLPAGAHAQRLVPLTGVHDPGGLAVDSAGNLYVTDTGNNRVVKLTTG